MDNKKTSLFISMLVQSNIVINTKGRSLPVACSFSIKRKRKQQRLSFVEM